MSMLAQAARNIKNIWSHGDEEYDSDEEDFAQTEENTASEPSQTAAAKHDTKYSDTKYSSSYGGGGYGSSGSTSSSQRARSLRSVPIPLRAREKNIYTLRPKTQDEAAIAADYLKSGSAVVVNLESLEKSVAVRIIDFMSGVCYGLEGQGHAMKLGDAIFLFTPAEFEISSDELDYGENRDFFFKEIESQPGALNAAAAGASTPAGTNTPAGTSPGPYAGSFAAAYNTPQQHVAPQHAAPQSTPGANTQSTGASPQASAQAPSNYVPSGKAHVTIGGRPAPTSSLSPASRPASNPPSGVSRSWER